MSWAEYHRFVKNPVSFQDQESYYRRATSYLQVLLPGLLPQDRPSTFVLGGFHSPQTAAAFKMFCHSIHPNPDDKHIFLDMNKAPLSLLNPNIYPYRVQARLEEDLSSVIPSIDLLALDFTLNFMNKRQISGFASNIESLLSRNGLILATIEPPILFSFLVEKRRCFQNRVPFHLYSIKNLQRLMKPHLKVALSADYCLRPMSLFSLVALVRRDSDLEEDLQPPFFYDRH